ncbi:hypothetical protein AB4Z52_19395 [Rhizobium sp. 2YAF20]|uniref:hypothetical protein n=1 Tax=Rhizobium sp. 2YAF20 TaxID=3233027 RepID=UPI003F9DAFC5
MKTFVCSAGAAIPFPVFRLMTVMPIFRRKHRNVLSEALYGSRPCASGDGGFACSWDFFEVAADKIEIFAFFYGKIVPM